VDLKRTSGDKGDLIGMGGQEYGSHQRHLSKAPTKKGGEGKRKGDVGRCLLEKVIGLALDSRGRRRGAKKGGNNGNRRTQARLG